MHIAKEDIPVQIDLPGAVARQQKDFGDVTGFGKMGAEYFSFGNGTDITELLHGLEGNSCQSPHWGYVVKGAITALYSDNTEETSREGDMFYWPPGHSVRAEEDTDIVMFSPQHEHGLVIDHIKRKTAR
ncbi:MULTISPECIES: cupin domain-containing protein [Halomonadaceae]|uniref:Cupin domain-containing protein n=1 Tax=Vreelandella maris TaxID=2729617 RepID=A0A7Y6V770_9GAMM|nr:cupin domain-containing protein [Halomonas maris]NVF12944.1 cupin domain-containing protein [Halomonas maris]|tara:strand:- start:280 stop:666 length:387 start_codon:yes stop_codon:yes gene_type:complete